MDREGLLRRRGDESRTIVLIDFVGVSVWDLTPSEVSVLVEAILGDKST